MIFETPIDSVGGALIVLASTVFIGFLKFALFSNCIAML